jgi:hypothetical protein
MKRKILSVLFAVLLLTIVFSGCDEQKPITNTEDDSEKFIGIWKNRIPFEGIIYFYNTYENGYAEWTFFENKTVNIYYERTVHTDFSRDENWSTWYGYQTYNNILNLTNLETNLSILYDYSLNEKDTIINLTFKNTSIITVDNFTLKSCNLYKKVDNEFYDNEEIINYVINNSEIKDFMSEQTGQEPWNFSYSIGASYNASDDIWIVTIWLPKDRMYKIYINPNGIILSKENLSP